MTVIGCWAADGFVGVMKRTFKIVTLGCKVNQYESAYLQQRLEQKGWTAAAPDETSRVTIVNTCIVTQAASHQSRQEIRKAIRAHPEGIVAAIGCYGQAFPEELRNIKGLRLIAGNVEKGKIVEVLSSPWGPGARMDFSQPFTRHMRFEAMNIRKIPGRSRAFVKIQDGCESFCSYCIVPFARGPYRSLPMQQVLGVMEELSAEGYREVVLTGIHLGKYGTDLGNGGNLKTLLRAIGERKLPLRVRLSSLEPGEIDDELIEMVASEEWLCRHFHIPLQSGDDGILKRMSRTYSSRTFASLVKKIYETVPLVAIGADVMTGFPGEDEAAHTNSARLIESLPVSYLHVFPYSQRPGTPAAGFPQQVPPEEKRRRAADLRSIGKRKKQAFYNRCKDALLQVVAEGWHSEGNEFLKGVSDNYVSVLFPFCGAMQNQPYTVRIEKVISGHAVGRPVLFSHQP